MDEVETISTIADGLSEAQRNALLRAEPDGHLGKYFIRSWTTNARTLRSLKRIGLGTQVWSGLMLSTDAVAVREYLRSGK